jgi:hypothetical protein
MNRSSRACDESKVLVQKGSMQMFRVLLVPDLVHRYRLLGGWSLMLFFSITCHLYQKGGFGCKIVNQSLKKMTYTTSPM